MIKIILSIICCCGCYNDDSIIEMIICDETCQKWAVAINGKIYRNDGELPQNVKKIEIRHVGKNSSDIVAVIYFDDGTVKHTRIGESIMSSNDEEL